jgi:ABC-type transport system substrate-binding protein
MGNQLPYVESVRILIIPDASVRQAALRTGKIDQLLSLPGDDPAYIEQRTPDLMSIKVNDNSDPMSSRYNFWWPWVKNYKGELTIGYYNSIWTQYIWIDQDLKKAMGY